LFEQVAEANFTSGEQVQLQRRAKTASEKLAEAIPFGEDSTFSARYIYDKKTRNDGKIELVYPADSWHYSAYIEGRILGVRPLLVEHPAPNRDGSTGYRLCAEIEASRVMGWNGGHATNRTITVYAPIGEISANRVPYDQGMSEMLEPQEKH
jgi:hypothetical protein